MFITREYKLTEEIARWAYEVNILKNNDWHLAFTNPTAGPWKRITATNESGLIGEVHRFGREDERPDLLLFSDKYEIVLIIEAKDSLKKLLETNQIKKSAKVVLDLAELLNMKENTFWGERKNFTIICGLLWGAEKPTNSSDLELAFKLYGNEMKNSKLCTDFIIGIETFKDKKGELHCKGYASHPDTPIKGVTSQSLIQTLIV